MSNFKNNNFLPPNIKNNSIKITKVDRNDLYKEMKKHIKAIREFTDESFKNKMGQLFRSTSELIENLFDNDMLNNITLNNFKELFDILRKIEQEYNNIMNKFEIELYKINGKNTYDEIDGKLSDIYRNVKKNYSASKNHGNLLDTLIQDLSKLKKYSEKYNYSFYEKKFSDIFNKKYKPIKHNLFESFITKFDNDKKSFINLLNNPGNTNNNNIIKFFINAQKKRNDLRQRLINIGNNADYKEYIQSSKTNINKKYSEKLDEKIRKYKKNMFDLILRKENINNEIDNSSPSQNGGGLTKNIKKLENNIKDMHNKLISNNVTISNINKQIININTKIRTLTEELSKLESTKQQFSVTKLNKESEILLKKESLKSLFIKLEELNTELLEKQRERANINYQIEHYEKRIKELEELRKGNLNSSNSSSNSYSNKSPETSNPFQAFEIPPSALNTTSVSTNSHEFKSGNKVSYKGTNDSQYTATIIPYSEYKESLGADPLYELENKPNKPKNNNISYNNKNKKFYFTKLLNNDRVKIFESNKIKKK